MARESDAKRMRKKLPVDPTRSRGTFGDIDTFERKTPTKKLRQERKENKHKGSKKWADYEDLIGDDGNVGS